MTLTLNQAAKESGRAKSTISKALKSGKLSYVSKTDAGYEIDPAELHRVFPPRSNTEQKLLASNLSTKGSETRKQDGETPASVLIEIATMRAERDYLKRENDDLRGQRDSWQEQAQQAQALLLERPKRAEKQPVGWFDRLLGRVAKENP